MKALLVFPTYPDTFWSFRYALKFISKKASLPPLGLLTVAAILPSAWEKRLIDTNVQPLMDKDLEWADLVFLSGMSIQRSSARLIIDRCKSLGKVVIAGGPLFTALHSDFSDVNHLVLNEAEITLPRFLSDWSENASQHIYQTKQWADITATPVPLWDLIRMKHYSSMSLQYSRGCPYDCEFCDITVLYGRTPRTKTKDQLLAECDALYQKGWRGGVFFVDDNFIGNKNKLKTEILPELIRWMKNHHYPFDLYTEVSINLADDARLMRLMTDAGFQTVFVGIESPHDESLVECHKAPNRGRDLAASVKTIQRHGLQIQGGFIVGFDHDPASIFQKLIDFIQESGIVTAMVGLLNAPVGSRLYHRLISENRLIKAMSGDNTDFSTNIIPKMGYEALVKGYKEIIATIYAPSNYYARVREFLRGYKISGAYSFHIRWREINAFLKSIIRLGVVGKERIEYWKLLAWSLFTRPRLFPLAVTLSIYGFHFRKIFESQLRG